MSVNTNSIMSNAYNAYASQNNKSDATAKASDTKETASTKGANKYGKTVGEPKLSDKAAKYYESLKKKYGNYDFVLVSEDQKANAQANASKYANAQKTVVLIDEAKIEKMATDEKFRKQYEGILSGATAQIQQMKSSMEASGASANVVGYGMQVNDNGTTSFFAVLKKSSADQKARIEKTAEKKKAEKHAAEKKAQKKAQEERIKKASSNKASKAEKSEDVDAFDEEDTVTITASSMEELMQKISDFAMAERSDNVQTESEMKIGQTIDFKG